MIALSLLAVLASVELGPLGGERLVAVDDRSTRALDLVLVDAGLMGPIIGGPYPVRRAANLIDRLIANDVEPIIDANIVGGPIALSAAEAHALQFNLLSFAIYDDSRAALQLSPVLGLEVYGRDTPISDGLPWDHNWKERLPLMGLDAQGSWFVFDGLELWGRMTIALTQDPNLARQGPNDARSDPQRSNIMGPEGVDWSFPHRAVVGLGGEGYSLVVGRDRLNVGNGKMGNLILGDVADFHDFARAQLYLPTFTFTSLVVRLDPTLTAEERALPGMDQLIAEQKHLIMHRADVVLFDKLHLSVSEAWLAGGVPLDVRQLNPLLVFHNLFSWNEAGAYDAASIMVGLEATLVPVRGVKLWWQYGVNQITFPLEELWYGDAARVIPGADGMLAGAELTMPLTLFEPPPVPWMKVTGVLHAYAGVEVVQTSPWFGVREHPYITWTARRRVPSNLPGGAPLYDSPLGWRDGPDSQTWRVWLGVLDVGAGDIELGYEERLRGALRFTTPYVPSLEAAALTFPTGTPQLARVVTVTANLLPWRYERFSGRLRVDWRQFFVENFEHQAGVSVVDHQLVMSAQVNL